MHLFSNATLDEQCMIDIQRKIDKYVNKKRLMSGKATYLAFRDGGTGTCNLYLMYLASKVTWIAKLIRQNELTKYYKNYRIPAWADPVIKTLRFYGWDVAHLNIIGTGDLELIALILRKEGLTFWAGIFYEYIELLGIADIDGENNRKNKNDKTRKAQPYCSSWMNHRLIGSKYINNINMRIKQMKKGNTMNLSNGDLLSAINPRLHPVLDIGCADLGSHISRIGLEKNIPDTFYKFEQTTIPDRDIVNKLKKEATKLYKKIASEDVGKQSKDNIACILRFSKGCMSKLYNFIIRRKFMYNIHPNLKARWSTVFQYKKTIRNERVRHIMYENRINTENIIAGLRNMLGCNVPAVLKKPTHEMILGAMRTECHIVRFQSHPTNIYRACYQCKCEVNNTAHVCYYCPLVYYIRMILEHTIYIALGIKLDINFTFGVLNFLPNLKGMNSHDKKLIIIWMMIVRKVIYNIFYKREQFEGYEIWRACLENINLIRIFRRENKLYLNQKSDFRQLRILDYMCDVFKKVIDISPRLSTIIRKYKRNDDDTLSNLGNLNHMEVVRYRFFLNNGINEPSNEFLLRRKINHSEVHEKSGYMDKETRLDIDNDRRRHGIDNKEKIELLYMADKEFYSEYSS